jgi:oxalate decarboxylase/phosphoglucose isomerase-like protein (cupin superfamily)
MADVKFIEIFAEMHQDERGFSFFPWQGRVHDPQEAVRTGHLVSIRPGQSRGHHYHPGHAEWLFSFHGGGVLIWEEAGKVQQETLSGRGALVCIGPGVPHALRNPGPEILYLLAWREAAGSGATEPESVGAKKLEVDSD